MDGYGQSFLGHNYYGFNLLRPSYHDEQLIKLNCSFEDGFGFDPSATELAMLNQYPNTADMLHTKSDQPPCELLATSSFLQSSNQTRIPIGQYSSRPVPFAVTRPRYALTESQDEETVDTRTEISSGSGAKRKRDKVHTVDASVAPKSRRTTGTMGSKQSHPSFDTAQSPRGLLGLDQRKEQSLEKNRAAASKCRIKKKERNEEMLEASRTKVKENKLLRDVIRTMEIEMHTLRTFLSAHSDSSNCKKPDELKDALQMLQKADMGIQSPDIGFQSPDIGYGSAMAASPALSFSGKTPSSASYSLSPATPSLSTMQTPTLDSFLLGDMDIDSPPYVEASED